MWELSLGTNDLGAVNPQNVPVELKTEPVVGANIEALPDEAQGRKVVLEIISVRRG